MASALSVYSERVSPVNPALSGSYNYLQGMLDALSGSCALLNPEGQILAVNQDWMSFAKANDYRNPSGKLAFGVGTNYLQVCDGASGDCEDGAARVSEGIREVARGSLETLEHEYPCHSPTIRRWFKCIARRMFLNQEGDFVVLVQHVDISENVLAREDLSKWSSRFSTLVDALGIQFWRLEPDRDLIWMPDSIETEKSFELSKSIRFSQWIERVDVEDRPQVLFALRQAANGTAQANTFSFRLHMPNGSRRRYLCVGGLGIDLSLGEKATDGCETDDPAGFEAPITGKIVEGLVIDITHQWRADIRERGFDDRLRRVFEDMPVRLANLDRQCRYRFVNSTFASGVELTKEEIEGQTAEAVLGAEAWKVVQPYAERALAGEQVTFNTDLEKKDGEVTSVEVTYVPDTVASGRVDGFFAVVFDITKHRRREQELTDAKLAAETANNYKTNFPACTSHDLRTPLNAILGFSSIIKDHQFGPPGQGLYRQYASYIHESGSNLLGIVDKLLDLAAIESGKRRLDLKTVDLVQVLYKSAASLQAEIEAKSISITLPDHDSIITTFTDELATLQIFDNLLTNAVKFNEPGGSITVSVRRTGQHCEVEIADTGSGMTEEEIERVTDPFARASKDPRHAQAGWGLGLAIC